MELLFLADESEEMIDCYLERGTMFVLDDDGVKAECVVTDEGDGILEIKNIAVLPGSQKEGYGRALIMFLEKDYNATGKYTVLRVGTGDSPLTIPFYEKCGFSEISRIRNFFTDHYHHSIIECGIQLKDMVILEKSLSIC